MKSNLFTCPDCGGEFEPEEFSADDTLFCPNCNVKIRLRPDGGCTCALDEPQDNVVSDGINPDDKLAAEEFYQSETPSGPLLSSKNIITEMKNDNCNMILTVITLIWLLIFGILFLYNCIFASSIIRNAKEAKDEKNAQISNRVCTESLENFGKTLMQYAKEHNGNLPDSKTWSSQCSKYMPQDYNETRLSYCLDYGKYDVYFDRKITNSSKDNDTVLIACPRHKQAFYANGKINQYVEGSKK